MAARPTATIAQIAGAKHINTFVEQVAAANLKLGGAPPLFSSFAKSAVADLGLGKGVADAFATLPRSTLDIASITAAAKIPPPLLSSLAKSAVADLGLGKGVADAFATLPKNKLAGYPFLPKAKHAGPHGEPELNDGAEEEESPEGQS
jgi:hypothetical protein